MAAALQQLLLEPNDDFSMLCREDTRLEEKLDNFHKSLRCANEHLTKCITAQEEEILALKMFLVEKCGANLNEITPELKIRAKRPRKSKIEKLQMSLPGF